jgi:DNA-directed RNA polymerases I, II, and III subunit RPABC3
MENDGLVDALFVVTKIDPDGKKFDRVSRCVSKSAQDASEIVFDYNSELLSVGEGATIRVSFLKAGEDGDPLESFLSDYDYVMQGKIYSIKPASNGTCSLSASFGGLLLNYNSSAKDLEFARAGAPVYFAIKVLQ